MTIRLSDLQTQKLFSALTPDELQQICDAGIIQSYQKGEHLIREGSLNHFLFFIAKGAVHIKSYGVKLAKLSAGHLLGEISAAGLGTPIADVVATGPVTAYKFPADVINRIATSNQAFGATLHDEAMARVLR